MDNVGTEAKTRPGAWDNEMESVVEWIQGSNVIDITATE